MKRKQKIVHGLDWRGVAHCDDTNGKFTDNLRDGEWTSGDNFNCSRCKTGRLDKIGDAEFA